MDQRFADKINKLGATAFRLYVPDVRGFQFGQKQPNNQLYLLEALGLRCFGLADLKKFGKVLPRPGNRRHGTPLPSDCCASRIVPRT